jgi:UDP-glucose 4-epimerase
MLNNRNIKILVTGGAGFIGSHLVDKLLLSGYNVVVIDNLSNGTLDNLFEAQNDPLFSFVNGDVLSKDDCEKSCENVDFIFHLACLGVRHSLHDPFENHRVNAEGTLNMLEAANKNKIKHFFYISTSEVYGRTTTFPISEDSNTKPITVYGSSKLAGEHYTNSYLECFGLKSTILRIFNNYGPRAHYEGDSGEVIPRSIVRILNEKQPIIFGDGKVTRDFFYVKDTASVLSSLIILKDNLVGETMNIGTGVEVSIKELLTNLLMAMGKSSLGIKYLFGRPADVPRLWVDNSKFKRLMNYKSKFDFDFGLDETIKYYEVLNKRIDLISKVKDTNWNK